MQYLQQYCHTDELTFPLLIDKTDHYDGGRNECIVIHQSHDIILHLWERYGQDVIRDERRVDQIWNSNSIPFIIKFISLASPTYLRAWPTCGLMQSPSSWVTDSHNGGGNNDSNDELVLHQVEGCPESRLVREALCTLEIPYLSIPTPQPLEEGGGGGDVNKQIPVLIDGDKVFRGADSCVDYLWRRYADPTRPSPTWWSGMPLKENIGRKQGLFAIGAYEAFRRGRRSFVPEQALRLMSTTSNSNDSVKVRNILAESWSSIANEYDAILVPRFRPWTLDALLALDDFTKNKNDARFRSIKSPRAICLCCGPGQELLPIAKILGQSSKVLGTDLAQGMVDTARRRIEQELNQEHNHMYKGCITVEVGDAMKPPPGSYHVIFSAFGLQQLPCPLSAVKSWLETLNYGGLCVFIYWPPNPPKALGQESCPFELWKDLVQHKLGTQNKDQEEPWDTNLVNAISSASGEVLDDRYITHDIEWKDGRDMFNGMSMAGPQSLPDMFTA
jgi:SAM-dependent methyltransferase/glutathione S-transferase